MARTALDLTPEEWNAYEPGAENAKEAAKLKERKLRAWQVACEAARVLRERFDAKRVVVFGSLAHGRWFSPWSDIDLVAWGIPSERFYSAVAAVTGLSTEFKVDLIDPDECQASICKDIEDEGIEL